MQSSQQLILCFIFMALRVAASALSLRNPHGGGRNMQRINSISFPLLNLLNLFLGFTLRLDLISSNFYRSVLK